MKAVIAHAFGPPDHYRFEELETPPPPEDHVRVAVRAAGVSFVDVLMAAGRYQVKPPLPYIPGTEFSGVIEAIGPGVSGFSIGERVFAGGFGGGFAEAATVPAKSVRAIPDSMSFEDAAVFRVSYSTGYYALVQRGNLQPGETLLVLGAGGAVGQAAIQLGKALGASVIASASSPSKRALALASGADHAIETGAADWRDQIKRLTDGRGVDVVIDPVGGAATELAFRSLAWKGRLLVIGFTAGEIPKIAANLALLKGASLVGVDIRQFGLYEPETAADNIQRVLDLYAQGKLRPVIAERRPLEDFVAAMKLAEAGATAGRIVLTVGGG
jgi:NADPH2:quinone reductase